MKNFLVFIVGAIIGAAAIYFYCCKDDMKVEMTEPKGIISPDEAKTLDQAFDSRHQLISDSILKRPDNRSSWYSLSDMRSYLNSAEKQTDGLGYKMNGIRVYLGAYPNTANQPGYTTMFFVPTGFRTLAKGTMNPFNFMQSPKNQDIPGGIGLNMGGGGNPPDANYPQY